MTGGPSVEDLAEAVGALVAPVFASLEVLAGEVLACRRRAPGSGCTERDLVPLERAIAPRLAAHPAVLGMGYVAAPWAVEGQERYLLWWQRTGEDLARLRLNFDPSSVDVYDYLQMEWYRAAASGGVRNAFGPYVDYSGSGSYVVTASVPAVDAEGTFVGVAGADISMAHLESRLIAILRTVPVETVVMNDEARVLAANTARWVVGARLSTLASEGSRDGFVQEVAVPGGFGWRVATTGTPVPGTPLTENI